MLKIRVSERERQKDRDRERETERDSQRQTERAKVYLLYGQRVLKYIQIRDRPTDRQR